MHSYMVELSAEVDECLKGIAQRNGLSLSEVMRRAFALLAVAEEEKRKGEGYSVGIVREHDDHELEAIARITGV